MGSSPSCQGCLMIQTGVCRQQCPRSSLQFQPRCSGPCGPGAEDTCPRPGAHRVLSGPSTSPVCPGPFTAPAQPPNGGVDSSHVPGQQLSAPMSLQRQLGAHIGSDNSERWVQGDSVESRSDPWQGACTTKAQRH